MSEHEDHLFGLIKLAERNQDAVGKASKHAVAVSAAAAAALKEAAAQHQESVNTLTKAASAAIAQAVHGEAKEMAKPLLQAAAATAKAAQDANAELKKLSVAVILAAFAIGALTGGGVVYWHQQKIYVPVQEVLDYVEKHPPSKR